MIYQQRIFVMVMAILAMTLTAFSQSINVSLKVQDEISGLAVPDVEVWIDGDPVGRTNEDGSFQVKREAIPNLITLIKTGFVANAIQVNDQSSSNVELGTVKLTPRKNATDFAVLEQAGGEDDDLEEEISSLLAASRDIFVSSAAFQWGPLRFNIRGLQPSSTNVYINGFEVNDAENGRVFWNLWGGLNDVTRNSFAMIGMGASDYDIGNIGGVSYTDMTPINQRKQLKASYSVSNRSYRNRIMLTYSSGRLKNGWYLTASGSRRWAQEGYTEGTFYDAWAYYLGVSKEIGANHTISLYGFGAPIARGRNSPGAQISYDIAGSNFYNSYWGFQNGEKRNSRVSNTHIPTVIADYKWKINDRLSLNANLGYQKGKNASSALNWGDAPDPRPDYYQKLPAYFSNDPEVYQQVYDKLKNDENSRQIDWHALYNRNRDNVVTIENVDGISGNDVTGLLGLYTIEDRHYDPESFQAQIRLVHRITDKWSWTHGARFQNSVKDNYKVLDDLLGSDFFLDINKFLEDEEQRQIDLQNPNRLVREGDRFGYSYKSNINKVNYWTQSEWKLPRLDFFVGGRLGNVSFFRTGDYQAGPFPEESLGDSETKSFVEYTAKMGLTFKITGRHYVTANGYYGEQAPFFSNSMITPRTRNEFRQGLDTETRYGGELAYLLRSPNLKVKLLAYYNKLEDQIRYQTAFIDNDLGFGEFGSILTSNIDHQHAGVEAAIEASLGAGFRLGLAGAIGEYIYTDRFNYSIFTDISPVPIIDNETIYSKNFYIPGTPQRAGSIELKYNAKRRWFASITANYLSERYIDFYPLRRSVLAVGGLDRSADDEIFLKTIEQEKIDPAFTVNVFGGNSWRINDYTVLLTIGVNNILNNQEIITGGFEQFRFGLNNENKPDLDRFPNKYWYAYGLNYFVNLSVRL